MTKMFQPPVQAPSTQTTNSTPIVGGGTDRASTRRGESSYSAAQLMQLQKTVGNRAVTQMLKNQATAKQLKKDQSVDPTPITVLASPVVQRDGDEEEAQVSNFGTQVLKDIFTNKILPEVGKSVAIKVIDSFMLLADALLASAIPNLDTLLKYMGACLNAFTKVTNFWSDLGPNVRAGLKFVMGVVLYKVDNFLSSYAPMKMLPSFEANAADDAEGTVMMQSVIKYLKIAEQFLDKASVMVRVGDYMKRRLGLISDEAAPEQGAQEDAQAEQTPSGTSLDLKVIKLEMQDLSIVRSKTDDNQKELGGLDAKSKVTIRLFGQEYTVDEIHARLGWDLSFAIDMTLRNKLIIGRSNFLIFDMENLVLEELTVGNRGLDSLVVSVAKFKVGSLLELDKISGGYQKGEGYQFGAGNIQLNLPAPFDTTLQAAAQLQLEKDGAFRQLDITNFKAGENFTVQQALVTREYLRIVNAMYDLTPYGMPFKPTLDEIQISKDKKIDKIQGGVTVKDWSPLTGLTINGHAAIGYENLLYAQVDDANVRLDYKMFQGYGSIKHLRYDTNRKLEGEIDELTFTIGKFTFAATKVDLNPDGTMSIAEAEVVLGGGKDKVAAKDVDEIGGDKEGLKKSMGFDAISGGGGLSELAQVHLKAKNITIRDGKVNVGEYEKWVGPSKVMKISLFGGAVQGLLDQEKEKAAIAGQFKFPSDSGFWPIKVGATLPISPTPISLFMEVGIGGGISAKAAGLIERDKSIAQASVYNIKAMAELEAELSFSIGAGVKLGHEILLALRAYLQATATLSAATRAAIEGKVKLNPDTKMVEQDPSNPVVFRYELEAELKAKLDFVIDLVAFLFYKKEVVRKNLGNWTLGSYRMAGSVRESKGKLTDEVTTPRSGADDTTLGGAIPGQVKLPEDDLVKEMAKRKHDEGKGDQPYKSLYRTAHDKMSAAPELNAPTLAKISEKLRPSAEDQSDVPKVVERINTSMSARREGPNKSYLMSNEEWLQYSNNAAQRKTVILVDKALQAYHAEKNPRQKLVLLEQLRDIGNQYILDKNKSRWKMVFRLLLDTNKEEAFLREQIEASSVR
ncbi:hypothetical protein [Tumebacillus permanentifrigoris]|uniref:Uncharacterized protein n=1 Tax=Tumebacillus permanentifrigoris TaxID=378543 RepID=A0A316D851_9BACL|nr:hypothetical protein [Tumebacillus permanentifrigoris]PWK09608.1 hypothetical protein C7459_11342 [Tumebacillus permanentifrigoris]